jgi:SpoIID/LytB domain protein
MTLPMFPGLYPVSIAPASIAPVSIAPASITPASIDPIHPPSVSVHPRRSRSSSSRLVQSTLLLVALVVTGRPAQATDVPLQVGIVQRFGTQASDTIRLQANTGDRLTIRFRENDANPNSPVQTLTAPAAKLEIAQQPLPAAQVEERVVLSNHRSFESAEADANTWKAQGLEVEVVQPRRWQVWAKRDVYKTPLLRRLLIESLQANGHQLPYIESKVVTQVPQAVLVINNQRYARHTLEIASGSGAIQVNASADPAQRLFAGSLRLQPNAYGTYTLVNQVPLETYLRGVVPYEIGTEADAAVLEVQAILARTYVLRNLRRFAMDGYQICADTQCQVYYGLNGAVAATDRAIATTAGQVLTYQNELVDAVYSSTTGGVTASFTDAWHGPPRPYLRPIIDSVYSVWDPGQFPLNDEQNFRRFISQKKGFNEEGGGWFRWKNASKLEDLNQELRTYLKQKKNPLADFKTIQDIAVAERSPSGRVLKLRVTTDQGAIDLEKDMLLVAFEAPNSTLFYVDPVRDPKQGGLKGFTFTGGGLGHGVGLSQVGSYKLGKLGWTNQQILSFYFPDTQLQPINNSLVLWRDPQNPTSR